MPPFKVNSLVEFWQAVDKLGDHDCWLWTRSVQSSGYGQFRLNGRLQVVHRISYEALVGPIPEGLTLDHLCRNRRCVNPRHLEPVTNRENLLRGEGHAGRNARKTHCKRGHEFTPENTYAVAGGGRGCRECRRTYSLRSKEAVA